MLYYRLTKLKYLDGLDTNGAESRGGRFNSAGVPLLYLSSSQALATLEVRVHARKAFPRQRYLYSIEIPDDEIKTLKDLDLRLPKGWDARPPTVFSQIFGDEWVASAASLALAIPSVVSDTDLNLLVNPRHPAWSRVKQVKRRKVTMDARLWTPPAKKAGPR